MMNSTQHSTSHPSLILSQIEKAQLTYLRTDDYASYRSYCKRRLHSKCTPLESCFWRAERAWSYGMHLREMGIKRHAISRFKKAVKYAASCQHPPYLSWMQATLAFERQQWIDSLMAFKRARHLSFARGPSEVFSRYCEYQAERQGHHIPVDVDSVQEGLEDMQLADSSSIIIKYLSLLDDHARLEGDVKPKKINITSLVKHHKACQDPLLSSTIQLIKAWNHLCAVLLHKSSRRCKRGIYQAQQLTSLHP